MFPCLIDNFLSGTELVAVRTPRTWYPSVVVDDKGTTIEDPGRTCKQARLSSKSAAARLICQRLGERLPECIGLEFQEGSFVRYRAGDSFQLHGDASGLTSGREWTVLVCLKAAECGGETVFPSKNKTFKLEPGQALVWPNYIQDNENESMDHEAKAPVKGVKIVINAWFGPAGSPESM